MSSPSLAPTMAVSPMASVLVKLSTSALGIGSLLGWRLPRGTGGSAGCLFWLMMSCCASRVLLYMVGLPPVILRCQMLMYAWVMFSWAHVSPVLHCLHLPHLILLLKCMPLMLCACQYQHSIMSTRGHFLPVITMIVSATTF